jgi:hypothetical protein
MNKSKSDNRAYEFWIKGSKECTPLVVVFSALVNLIMVTGPHDQMACHYTTHGFN